MYIKLALGNIRKSFRDFGIYFITTALGIAVFYAFNAISDQEALGGLKMMELLGILVTVVSVFIAIILGFLVIYANRFLMRRRKKEFGLYLCLGMSRSDVIKITLIETLLTGLSSLIVGIVIGLGITQLLMFVTSFLFPVPIPGIVAKVSLLALGKTAFVFMFVFIIAALVNSGSLMKTRLVSLLQADRTNETLRLRSIPLSLFLFIVSCIIIGISYYLLIRNGLLDFSPEFMAATILVCVGTFLFFYSLSGFLLRLIQSIKPLYLRGLNMFTLRQLNSKINTAFFSLSLICITLFLAISSVCGGFGISNALTSNLQKITPYDVSLRSFYPSEGSAQNEASDNQKTSLALVKAHNYQILDGLRASIPTQDGVDFDKLISKSTQLDYLSNPLHELTFGELDTLNDKPFSAYENTSNNFDYTEQTIPLLSLSQVNETLTLAGKKPINLNNNECALIFDSNIASSYLKDICAKNPSLTIGQESLTLSHYYEESLDTSPFPFNVGALIVPDTALPKSAVISYSVLNAQCPSEDAAKKLVEVCQAIEESETPSWPIQGAMTRTQVIEQSSGLSACVAFLAIYIGFILVIACAAILAIQQLSEASDSAHRYKLLNNLGASQKILNRSLLTQIAIYFIFPLALAFAHSFCALQVITKVVAALGHLDIGFMAFSTLGVFLGLYGLYFLVTYFSAKRFVLIE